ncbi:MAG: MBL fold metallo-hydrolase [Elusimicrobia bacterium]|nr:MBL fold metallo-hydrolase [Elusimicrobiota bacterium]
MANFSYILYDDASGKCVLIDPSWEPQKIQNEAANYGITAVFLTHAHFDHVKAVDHFLAKHSNLHAYIHKNDFAGLSLNSKKTKTFEDGHEFKTCGFNIKAIHTPGHTPGSACFLADNKLFTGDTLFVRECGRVDLPGSSPEDLWKSFLKLASMPDETAIYPGHFYNGSVSTIGEEKQNNIYMKLALKSREEFLKAVV